MRLQNLKGFPKEKSDSGSLVNKEAADDQCSRIFGSTAACKEAKERSTDTSVPVTTEAVAQIISESMERMPSSLFEGVQYSESRTDDQASS